MSAHHDCTNCSADHEHFDTGAHAHKRRAAMAWAVAGRLAVLKIGVDLLLLLPSIGGASIAMGAGLAIWALATGVGVLVAGLTMAKRGTPAAAMAGSLATAAITPLLIGVAVLTVPGPALHPLAVAVGYLIGGFGAETLRLVRLRALLGAESREGEVARESAAITAHRDNDLADFLGTGMIGVLVGAYTYLIALLPPLALVLAPLHVAGIALHRRRAIAARRRSESEPQRAAS